jgi:anti-sigma factor RsiW
MKCASARNLIEPHLDGELDRDLQAEIQDHLTGCNACTERFSRLRELQTNIRMQVPRYDAPAHFRIRLLEAARAVAENGASDGEGARWSPPWQWMAIAASALLAVSLAWNFTLFQSRGGGLDMIAQNVLSSHVRSLIGTHLLDVPSSDQHTVKPWFNGKLDFSPDVKDFTSQGFPLIGGRIEYLVDRPVAALVYRRRQHVVNLFTWPSLSSVNREAELTQKGYNLVHWNNASMTYWAVSDLRMSELQLFANLYRE